MQNDCGFTRRGCGEFIPGPETGKHDCLLSVAVLVLPTGEALWMESEKYNPGYMEKVIQAWKDQHPDFDGSKCSMGAVEIKMPLSQYKAIQTTNSFSWPDA